MNGNYWKLMPPQTWSVKVELTKVVKMNNNGVSPPVNCLLIILNKIISTVSKKH